jgi:hypothetical protein
MRYDDIPWLPTHNHIHVGKGIHPYSKASSKSCLCITHDISEGIQKGFCSWFNQHFILVQKFCQNVKNKNKRELLV